MHPPHFYLKNPHSIIIYRISISLSESPPPFIPLSKSPHPSHITFRIPTSHVCQNPTSNHITQNPHLPVTSHSESHQSFHCQNPTFNHHCQNHYLIHISQNLHFTLILFRIPLPTHITVRIPLPVI